MPRPICRLACLIGLLAAGCAGPPEPASAGTSGGRAPGGATPAAGVTLELEPPVIDQAQGRLRLRGTANLPDGALLVYTVKHDSFDSGDFDGYVEGQVEVDGGRFSHDVPVADWPPGYVTVRLAFQMNLPAGARQPDAVRMRYGDHGERIEGPHVLDFGGTRQVEVTATVSIR